MPSTQLHPTSAGVLPVPALIDHFLDAKIAKGLSVKTITTYRERLAKFHTWLGDRPLTRPILRGYLAYLQQQPQINPVSVASYFKEVRTLCAWLVEEGYLDTNPAYKLVPKTPKRRPASYSADQIAKLLAVCNTRDRAMIITLLDTGLRAGELVSLQRDSVDCASGLFTVIGKGNKERAGKLHPVALAAIRAYLDTRTDDDPALWYGRHAPLSANGLHQAIKRRAIAAGIRHDTRRLVHAFRATFAKNYLLQGGDLESLRRLLGHESIAMSAHYAQLADDDLLAKKQRINPLGAMVHAATIMKG